MGELQTSIKFFPEQLCENKELETKGDLCASEGSSLLQTGPKFQVRHTENKEVPRPLLCVGTLWQRQC